MSIPRLRTPIVLVHGFLGFDRFRVGGWTLLSYFAGIPEFFRQAGNRVHTARLSPTRSIAARAAELKAFVEQHVPAEPVHILAHSMGGLDARFMISRLEMAPRVLSLTTIGTPHRGTSFADWGVERLGPFVEPPLRWVGVPCDACHDLTVESCRRFNEQVPDSPTVRYFSVAGRHEGPIRGLEWRLPYRIVRETEGPNDTLVSVSSASYGESTEIWDCDHLELVNWPHPDAMARGTWRDRTADYANLVRRLADEGF